MIHIYNNEYHLRDEIILTLKEVELIKKLVNQYDGEKQTYECYSLVSEKLNAYNPNWDLETCYDIIHQIAEYFNIN